MKDVARRVGVSAMTVSRALTGKSDLVTAETAERCKAAARELGYVPNLMARSLRGQQLKTIVMFAEYISSHHYLAELVDIVSRSIEERGYGVICCQSLGSFHQSLRQFRLGGAVVIAPPEIFFDDPYGEEQIGPVSPPSTVLIHSAFDQTDFSEVSPDITGFCHAAARHLIELGHRELAFVGGPDAADEPEWFSLRRQGLLRALRECGIAERQLIQQPCANPDMGPPAVVQLLKRAPNTTGILCMSDEIAISVIAGLQAQGLRVPHDVSVVGCNNIHLSKYVSPSLTTISIDVRTMINRGLDMLFENGEENGGGSPKRERLQASLIIRDSTALVRAPAGMKRRKAK